MTRRPTFEELIREADALIGPPRPPKMQPDDPEQLDRMAREWLRAHGVNLSDYDDHNQDS